MVVVVVWARAQDGEMVDGWVFEAEPWWKFVSGVVSAVVGKEEVRLDGVVGVGMSIDDDGCG